MGSDDLLHGAPPADPLSGERMLAAILNSLSEAVITVGRDHRIASFNRAAERLVGIPGGGSAREGLPGGASRLVRPRAARLPDGGARRGGKAPGRRRGDPRPRGRPHRSRLRELGVLHERDGRGARLRHLLPQLRGDRADRRGAEVEIPVPRHRRKDAADPADLRTRRGGEGHGFHRADHRGERDRERAVRARDPRSVAPEGEAVRQGQRGGPHGNAARVRAVRPREGGLHGRRGGQGGAVRGGRRRDDLPRRDRRDLPGPPGEAASRPPGPRVRTRREQPRPSARTSG